MKKKTLALILALVMVFGAAVGGTIAWLTDKTDDVKNTFTVGNIDIDLTETLPENKTAKMVPGDDIDKNPTAIVKANSEDCWLFVTIEKANDFDKFMTYDMADGWTALSGVTGVFYRTVAANTADQSFAILKDNKVTVKDTITVADMDGVGTNYPTLTFKAYAIQQAHFENAANAWTTVSTAAVQH